MKKLLLLFLLLPGYLILHATGGVAPIKPTNRSITLKEFVKLTPKEYQKLTGKKLKLKEKIGLKILQWKVKRKMNDQATPEQIRLGRLSLIFGILAMVFIFIPIGIIAIIGLGFAIAGFVLGIKSIKGNSNVMGILGIVFSGLVLFFFLLALAIVAAWGWY